MRGHEPIISMRNAGSKPKIVFINDFPCQTSKDWHNPGEKYGEIWAADHATVSTAGDTVSSLDLRFLVGLTVRITAESDRRAKDLFAKARQFGATTVLSTSILSGWSEFFNKEEVISA